MPWFRGAKGFWSLLIIAVLLVSGLGQAYGDELSKYRQQQKELQEQMERQKQTLQQKNNEQKTFLQQLDVLEENLESVEKDLGTLENELSLTEQKLQLTERELGKTQKALDERSLEMRERLREIYINGQVTYLEVIFQATSVSDFLMRFDLMEKLVENDVELLNEIQVKKRAVEEKKQEIEEQRNRIADIEATTKNQQVMLENKQTEKKQLIANVEQDKAEIKKALDDLEKLSAQVANKIRQIQAERSKNSQEHFNGIFTWPTPGYTRVTSDYGMRIHPILKERRMHTGIDIAAPSGTEIHAAADGTVIYSDYLGAYGKAIIIDHGDGISTLYGHQSSLLVSENKKVKKGQVIGKVGSTGWSTGAHLHFEVRKSGDPINPWNYLK